MTTSGPVQRAVRAALAPGAALQTTARGAPFTVESLDGDALVLLLGRGRWPTRIPWEAIEGIPDFLRGRGWVIVGGRFSVEGESGTLDGHLKRWTKVGPANWVAVVLEKAGVVELDRGRPLRVRLKPGS